MVKTRSLAFITAGVFLLTAGLPAQAQGGKSDPPVKKTADQVGQKPREGSPGVTYTDRAAAPRVEAPPYPGLRIYSVTADAKTLTIHGFNKTGFTLALASDDVLVQQGRRGENIGFHPSVTFANQFVNGTTKVGTVTGSGNVWVVRGPAYDFWLLKGPPCDIWLSSWARSTRPPVLPEDGKSVTVPPGVLAEGDGALWLDFQTASKEGVSFLIVAPSAPVAGAAKSVPPAQQDKAEKYDLLARDVAVQFMKALKSGDVEMMMRIVDVPFFWDGVENIKDRDTLKNKMEEVLKKDRSNIEYKVKAVFTYDAILKLPKGVSEKDRKLLDEILEKTDRIVQVALQRDGIGIVVRIRDGKANVAGFRD